MASLIEQAAQRLAQLREATGGMEVPPVHASAAATIAAESTKRSRSVELDFRALSDAGIATPNAPRTRTADEFRVIKRPLIHNAKQAQAGDCARRNLIMVTSALPGEGKTFTSINLAMSIAAEMDRTVLLVDADVRRPTLLSALGLPPCRGLLEVLKGTAEMPDVLLRTNVERLTLLPCGEPDTLSTEFLASETMARLLDEIANRYLDRIVIFDSPPLLLTTEARVLATHVGQVLVVVQADKTLQSDVQQALEFLDDCHVQLVVNRAQGAMFGGRAYERYGYDYYGYGEARGPG